jgi:hypothetical protein
VARLPVYTEAGAKRIFVTALDWPGWSRAGRDETAAIASFIDHGPRYAAALGVLAASLELPESVADVMIVERLRGGSGTDFGVPSVPPTGDDRPVAEADAERLTAILRAAWDVFDSAAAAAAGLELAKGPRGGGRDLDRIVRHVWEADAAYHASLGHPYRFAPGVVPHEDMARLRESAIGGLRSRLAGEPLPPSKRTSPPWEPRTYVRRAAWHALDHAWEIEDRSGGPKGS